MPNLSNVNSPISIFGAGRSGTTLLINLLSTVPDVQNCNETIGLILGAWSGSYFSEFSDDGDFSGVTKNDFAIRAVHGAYVNTMPSKKPAWIQKLSGIPNGFVWGGKITESDKNIFSDLYPFPADFVYEAILLSFPHSKNILIGRNPLEIAVSRKVFSGWSRKHMLADLAVLFRFYERFKDIFAFVIPYSKFKRADSRLVSDLFSAIELEFDNKYMSVFSTRFVPSFSEGGKIDIDFVTKDLTENPLDNEEKQYLKSIEKSYLYLGLESEL